MLIWLWGLFRLPLPVGFCLAMAWDWAGAYRDGGGTVRWRTGGALGVSVGSCGVVPSALDVASFPEGGGLGLRVKVGALGRDRAGG